MLCTLPVVIIVEGIYMPRTNKAVTIIVGASLSESRINRDNGME